MITIQVWQGRLTGHQEINFILELYWAIPK